MTPGARVAAAIEILDLIFVGTPAEKVLTTWARGHRFAGSKDRAAIRDHVFDALRRLRSSQALGCGTDGRATMLGLLRGQDVDPSTLFTGEGHAPSVLTEAETTASGDIIPEDYLDCPAWLLPQVRESLGDNCDAILKGLRNRAPVFLRVNLAKATREEVMALLAEDGIVTKPHDLASTALEVLENPRKVTGSECYQSGKIELQDAASQALIEHLDIRPGMRVLDYCAGGGGKALAMAALGAKVVAHDISPERMKDLPVRADRAGVFIEILETKDLGAAGGYDLVLADAPCSGSGAWRRSPHGKWKLTQDELDHVVSVQRSILADLPKYVTENGQLAYATCSLLRVENQEQVANSLAAMPDWNMVSDRQFTPLDGGDGFYIALLTRES